MKLGTISIRRAIVLAVVLGLMIPALLISGLTWLKKIDEDVRINTQELLKKSSEALSTGMEESLNNGQPATAEPLLDMMMHNQDIVQIQVINNNLAPFASRELPARRIGNTTTEKFPLLYKGTPVGTIQIEVSSVRLKQAMIDNLLRNMLPLAIQLTLSIILILILLEYRLVRPLRQLNKDAEQLAGGKLDVPFTWRRLDEIGLLSKRLEATRISLSNLFQQLDKKNQELKKDIDTRRLIEHELHAREQRFQVLVQQSPIAIIEWDIYFRVIEWNAAAEKIFGYTREQALGQHASFISADNAPEAIIEIFRKLMAGSSDARSVTENRRANKKNLICQWSNVYIADQNGRAGRMISMSEDITDKRRAEEAYRLSQLKFASAFHGSPDYISLSRLRNGMLLDVNEAFEIFTGFSRKEVIGKTTFDLKMWPYPEDRINLIAELQRNRVAHDLPIRIQIKNGTIRSCLINANTFNIEGDPHMMAVVRDVTDQSNLKEQKEEVDRALVRLAQGIQGTVGESFFDLLVTDIASTLRVDRAFLGLRMDDASNRIKTIAAHGQNGVATNFDYAIEGSPCEHIMAGGIDVFSNNVQTRFPDDIALVNGGWESYAGAPIRDAGGSTIGVLAVMHSGPMNNPDLVKTLLQVFSERASAELKRKYAEEALRNSEQQFAAMFHASPVSMSLSRFGGEHSILDVNQAFERLFMRTRETVVGKDALELSIYCEPADRASIVEILDNKGQIDRFETWMNLGDGNKALIQLSGSMFELNDEKFIILTGEDVTEKHLIEHEILELNATLEMRVTERTEELQQANQELATTVDTLNMAEEGLVRTEKLAALGALVAGIAHELNTPIGNSLMVASTLIDRTRDFTESYALGLKRSMLDSYLADASKAGDILVRNLYRAADLVTSFKQVAVDQTSSQRRTFNLSEVIAEIVLTLSPTIKKTAYKVRQTAPKNIEMDSYPGPLGQVITNFINNAIIHAFDGRDSGAVSITVQPAVDGWVEMSFKDDGVGIPSNNINRIFDPFFTTKLGAGGSGLGLNITYTIVTSVLGGRIRVLSELGVGTTFIVTLPLTAP